MNPLISKNKSTFLEILPQDTSVNNYLRKFPSICRTVTYFVHFIFVSLPIIIINVLITDTFVIIEWF